MSLKVKSNWRIAANTFGLAVSLWLVGSTCGRDWHVIAGTGASSCYGRSGASACFPSSCAES